MDTCKAANRVTSRRWPFVKIYLDVREITFETCRSWALEFVEAEEVHVWAGFPCVDLSSVRSGRQGLQGKSSSLFFEVPKICSWLSKAFGRHVVVRKTVENVASTDRDSCDEISRYLGLFPYYLDSVESVPMRRPRLAWCSEPLEESLEGVTFHQEQHWVKVTAEADYPRIEDWITPGAVWPGGEQGAVFPTCMKAISRPTPPDRPAGYQRCDADTLGRWKADDHRYPPYQYSQEFVVWREKAWRLANASERELLMGYGFQHTSVCLSASDQKRSKQAYEDLRCSLIGDSFAMSSFVIPAAAMCKRMMAKVHYKHLCQRLGVAPGFRLPIRFQAPLCRRLQYGVFFGSELDKEVRDLNRYLLTKTNHTGSDIRITSGEIVCPRAFPRQSIESQWWDWNILFKVVWQKQEHISALELRSILLAVKFHVNHLKATGSRIFHVTDSYVCMSIIGKGRTGSEKMSWTLRQLNAILLAFGLQLIVAHVESTANPTDHASRS